MGTGFKSPVLTDQACAVAPALVAVVGSRTIILFLDLIIFNFYWYMEDTTAHFLGFCFLMNKTSIFLFPFFVGEGGGPHFFYWALFFIPLFCFFALPFLFAYLSFLFIFLLNFCCSHLPVCVAHCTWRYMFRTQFIRFLSVMSSHLWLFCALFPHFPSDEFFLLYSFSLFLRILILCVPSMLCFPHICLHNLSHTWWGNTPSWEVTSRAPLKTDRSPNTHFLCATPLGGSIL